MTIQVFPYNGQEESDRLDFLKSRHYNYKWGEESEMVDGEFLDQYNKELDEAEADMDAGNFVTHEEAKKFFSEKRNRASKIQ